MLVEVTGERVSDGPILSYTRLDRWRCDEDGLWNLGWLMDLRITDAFGLTDEVAASYTSYYAEDIGLVRRDDLVLIDDTPAR